jgi:putative aldouronate transport system substrate-binding protein
MHVKRLLSGILVLSIVVMSAPLWARGRGEAQTAKKVVTLNVLYPGEESERMRQFLTNEFREKTTHDIGVEIRMSYSPWSQYWNTLDLMLQSGKPLDWYWDGNFSLSGHVARGQCLPIDSLLDTYGQDIKRVIPAANFKALSIRGQIYGIPSQYAPSADKFLSILGREDLLSAVGVTRIESIADFVRACDLVKKAFPQITPLAGSVWRAMTRELSGRRELHLTGPTAGLFYVEIGRAHV